jgi:tetratricopeptide (TPR) repeat protein
MSDSSKDATTKRKGSGKPVLFFIPGTMRIALSADGTGVWFDVHALARSGLDKLAWIDPGQEASTVEGDGSAAGPTSEGAERDGASRAQDRLEAEVRGRLPAGPQVELGGTIWTGYTKLYRHLESTYDIVPFTYDWRRSHRVAGRALAAEIEKKLAETEGPIRVLAHSTGGLVARGMILEAPDVWEELASRDGCRLVMVGTPNSGAVSTVRMLLGRDSLTRGLASLDFEGQDRPIVETFRGFPGILETLPGGELDLFDADTWQVLDAHRDDALPRAPDRQLLEGARTFRIALDQPIPHPERILYVAGRAAATPAHISTGAGAPSFKGSNRGDGRVLWDGGAPDGVERWYADAEHGRLCDHTPAFDALAELLEDGDTQALPKDPPVSANDEEAADLPDDSIPPAPGKAFLTEAAWGYTPVEEGRPLRRVRVNVFHADLATADSPVVVGHYDGDGILHGEEALDYLVHGRLSRLHQLKLYPGPIGTNEVLLGADSSGHPGAEASGHPGAVVVGLGEVGQLSPRALTTTVKRGILRYAEAAWKLGETEGLELSFLLLGSGEGGVSVEASVRAILRAVIQANAELQAGRGDAAPWIGHVELIELYRDQALQAMDALERVYGETEFVSDNGPLIKVEPLQHHDSGQRRASYGSAPGWWDRLRIEMVKNELRFSSPTGRARVEDSSLHVQRALVDQLLDEVRERKAVDLEAPGALFELLFSNELKTLAPERRDTILVLDDGAAQFPWELMIDRFRGSGHPLCVGAGLIRNLRVDVPQTLESAHSDTVFVIGDPPSHWSELKGAQAEARAVVRVLGRKGLDASGGWDVTQQIRHDNSEIGPASILKALLKNRYRVLHIAAHGDYRKGDPPRVGVVIGKTKTGEKEDGSPRYRTVLLRPDEVLQMPAVPDLVFLNCCHLGRQARDTEYLKDRPQLASNMASQFIQNGVRAVIAAGWAVDDRAATAFAERFYEAMLDGRTFGESVRVARQHIYERFTKVNTWGAYQCYGDPGFRLVLRGKKGPAPRTRFLDQDQVVSALDNLASGAKVRLRQEERRLELNQRFDEIRENIVRLRPSWMEDGRVLAALARAAAELGRRDEAVDWYEKARDRDSGALRMKDLEQLANIRARAAAERFLHGDPDHPASEAERERALGLIDKSVRELERLIEIGPTNERYALLGSVAKRWAGVAKARGVCEAALRTMVGAYTNAHELSSRKPYALLNALTGVLVLGGPWDEQPEETQLRYLSKADFEEALRRGEELAALRARDAHDFWDRVYEPEAETLRFLYEGKLNENVERLGRIWEQLVEKEGSAREHASVRDQLGFLLKAIDGAEAGELEALRNQKAALAAILERLQ